MINKSYDWYEESLRQNHMIHEANVKKLLQKAIIVVSLLAAGYTIFDVAQKTGLSEDQVKDVISNEEIMNLIGDEDLPLRELPIPENSTEENLPPHGLPTNLDRGEIERIIRLHEVSGAVRNVTVNGREVDIRKVYPDPRHGWSVPTIGVGFNLNKDSARAQIEALGLDYGKVRRGEQTLTDQQVNILYRSDINNAIQDAQAFLPNFDSQPSTVKTILVDMAFNLGLTRLSTFVNLRAALSRYDFQEAANQMQDSAWSGQVGNRATRLIGMMRNVNPRNRATPNN